LFPCVLFCMYSMFLNIMFQLHVLILFLCVLFGVYCVFTGLQCFYVSRFHPFHKSIHSIILAHVSRTCPFFCLFTCVTISLVMVPQCFMFYICPCVTNLFLLLVEWLGDIGGQILSSKSLRAMYDEFIIQAISLDEVQL
jgi:hypothetical protein